MSQFRKHKTLYSFLNTNRKNCCFKYKIKNYQRKTIQYKSKKKKYQQQQKQLKKNKQTNHQRYLSLFLAYHKKKPTHKSNSSLASEQL